ncbi:RNA polymerase sigma factor [Devosia albogilva]|uniref:RNA polymerase sigma factor n=1 Tax=Devosia albogilva TaxID=429726 RepID=A0ABW5QKR7_9HYPH
MATVPPEWEAYARLQTEVARSSKADNRVEALEAAMNKLLDAGNSLDEQAVTTATKTAARRNRHRSVLRHRHLPREEPTNNPVSEIEARSLCAQVETVIKPDDLRVFTSVAAGQSHRQIASAFGCTPTAIGVRILRARRNVKAALPAQLLAELTEMLAA